MADAPFIFQKIYCFLSKTKHIDVHFYFVLDVFIKGDVCIVKISPHGNPTDMMKNIVLHWMVK